MNDRLTNNWLFTNTRPLWRLLEYNESSIDNSHMSRERAIKLGSPNDRGYKGVHSYPKLRKK